MRYTPHTPSDQEQMLRTIGIDSIEELYQHIPETLRNRAKINLPGGLTELAVRRRLAALASSNATASDWSFFLGGGIYYHFIPSAVDAVISRSEFATSYTPYQPEVSQGTLQALFEYQTLICQLTGMEISNAGVYDGASAAAEAVLMSRRIQPASRRRVLMSRALHPHYRAVIATYLRNLADMQLDEITFDASGATDVGELTRKVDKQSMCVIVGYPNFFGVIEDLAPIQAACAGNGAQLITVTPEPVALGLLKPPGAWGADIAVGEGQSLGVPMTLGGPGFGFFASQKRFVRSLPGRLVGETVDTEGRRGFVLTLAPASSISAARRRRPISVPVKRYVRWRRRCTCRSWERAACVGSQRSMCRALTMRGIVLLADPISKLVSPVLFLTNLFCVRETWKIFYNAAPRRELSQEFPWGSGTPNSTTAC